MYVPLPFSRSALSRALVLSLVVPLLTVMPASADPAPADPSGGPFTDQTLTADPSCDSGQFPGSRTLGTGRSQTFVASRGELQAVDLCLTADIAGARTYTIRIVDTSTGESLAAYSERQALTGTAWNRVTFGSAVAVTPGRSYRLEVAGPTGPNGQPVAVQNVAWRLSCNPNLVTGSCPAGTADRYPQGAASGSTLPGTGSGFGPAADFGFRTLTRYEADLVGSVTTAPRHVCPGFTLPMSITVSELGGGSVRESRADLFLDPVAGAPALVASFDVPPSAGTGPQVLTKSVTIPQGLAAELGRARFRLEVNATGTVVESGAGSQNNSAPAATQSIITTCDHARIAELSVASDRASVPAGVGMIPVEDLIADGVGFSRSTSTRTASASANGPTAYNPLPNGPTAYNPTDPNGPTAYNPTDQNGPTAYNPNQPNGPTAYNPTDPNGPTAYNPTLGNGPTAYNPLVRSPMLAAPLTVAPVTRGSSVLHDAPANARSFLFGAPLSVLDQIPLQTIALSRPGGWAHFLQEHVDAAASAGRTASPLASQPLQNLTLLDAMTLDPQPYPPILQSQLDLSASSIGTFSVAATTLGSTLLGAIPPPTASWCDVAATISVGCRTVGQAVELLVDGSWSSNATMVTLDALGADLSSVDLSRAPGATHPGWTLASVGLRTDSPLASVQLAITQRVSAEDATLMAWPLFNPTRTALASLPVDATWASVLTCPAGGCTGTLGQAWEANQFRTDASLGRLLTLVPPAVAAQVTLGQLLDGVTHDRRSLPWEDANLDGVLLARTAQRHDFNPATAQLVTWTATVVADATGAGLVDPTIVIELPATFAHVPSTATITATTDGVAAIVDVVEGGGTDGFTPQTVTITTDLHLAPGASALVTVASNPGATLGSDFTANAHASGTDILEAVYEASTNQGATVAVVERFGPTSEPDWPVIPQDTLVFSHLSPGDRDVWRVPVPTNPNWEVRITLSHVPVDADLVVGAAVRDALLGNGPTAYNPIAVPNGPTAYNPTPNGPTAYNPYINGPTAYNPNPQPAGVPESSADWDPTGEARDLPPQLLEDVPTDGPAFAKGIRGQSISRGATNHAPESVAIHVTEAEAGFYNVQVTGYNDATSDDYYVLRYHVVGAPGIDLGACRTLPWQPIDDGRTLPTIDSPGNVDPATNTLFLVPSGRLAGREGVAAREAVMSSLEGLAARSDLGVRGLVLPIEASGEVAAAYAAWDAARCDVHAANLASGRIRDLVLGYSLEFPIENVVIVGDDDLVPHMRYRDGSTQGNERAFTSFIVDAIADPSGANGTPATAALAAGMFLTDDHFGTPQARQWGDQAVFIPTMAIGRLPGDAASIIAAVDAFTATNGLVNAPTTGVGTGYAHNLDGGIATSDEIVANLGTNVTRLENETWSAAQLTAAINGAIAPGKATILSLNGHSDQNRFLSAAGNTSGAETELVDEQVIDGLPAGSVLFSMGCHFGYDLPPDLGDIATWRDAVAAQQGILLANTGYNYGDSTEIGAGELFSVQFAKHLDGATTVGQATAMAKAETFVREQGMERERIKALQGMVLYGLPMYRLAGATPPAPATITPLAAPADSLSTHELVLDFGFTPRPTSGGVVQELATATATRGLAVTRTTLAVDGRPVGPMAVLDVTGLIDDPTLELRGAIVTGLRSRDQRGVQPAFANTVVGDADGAHVRASLGIFPLAQASISTVQTVRGPRTYLTVLPWTFRSTGTNAGHVVGDLRLDERVTLALTVAPKHRWDGLHLEQVTVERVIDSGVGQLELQATTRDVGPASAVDIIATYRDPNSGAWHQATDTAMVDLGNGRRHWTLRGDFPTTTLPTEVVVTAWTADGVLGQWRNKGDLVELIEHGTLAFSITGTPGTNGWYVGPVTIQLPPGGGPYAVRRAGETEYTTFTGDSFTVSEDGIHVLDFRAANGDEVLDIPIKLDREAPVPTLSSPTEGAHPYQSSFTINADCPDRPPSGLASCTVQLDGATVANGSTITPAPGTHQVTVTAIDGAGNTGQVQVTFTINQAPLSFEGFFSPVENNVFNQVNAKGEEKLRTIPFKWRLRRDGVVVTNLQQVTGLFWQKVTCATTTAAAQPIGAATAATSSGEGLWLDTTVMRFNAEAPSSFNGSCRRFDVRLADGSTHSAWFTFASS